MILTALVFILVVGGVLAWLAARWHPAWAHWVSLAVITVDLALGLAIWAQGGAVTVSAQGPWLAEEVVEWIPRFGISYRMGLDGLSLLLILLTLFLGITAVASSWREITDRVGFFHFNLLWTLAGTIGVFLALDLFLFFFFWEVMLIPMYFLIAIWGHENRRYAALKFFIFTQGGGLLMLVAILALAFVHYRATGVFTFDYFALLGTGMEPATALWIMLGFFIAFAVKLPAVPLHTWLPDAHTEAPTAGSVILAGVLLKTGAYGLLRFLVPLFPAAAFDFALPAMALGVVGILYGAVLAFAQTDLKRLVAYTSISHMGFVLLGIFAWNELALHGAVMQMIAHGISTGALFILVGMLQERMHTRDMGRMGGLWSTVPRLSALGLFFAIASLGLPGLANFVGEFLVLVGAYRVNVVLTVLAALGLVAAAIYALILVQKSFHGENREGWRLPDTTSRELATLLAMAIIAVWLGLYPRSVLVEATPAIQGLQRLVAPQNLAGGVAP